MSTRSIILVTGNNSYKNNETIRLYKHSDGYPTGNLPIIAEALKKAVEQCNEQNERFEFEDNNTSPTVYQLTGLIIGASTDVYGIGANIDDDYECVDKDRTKKRAVKASYRDSFKTKHLGTQNDLEWIYVIDLNKKTVNVYGGGYTGSPPQVAFKKGLANPLAYADCLRKECQEDERKETLKAIKEVESTGFRFNPKRSIKKKAKVISINRVNTGVK